MLYQEYKKKVLKFIRILEAIRRYRVLIISIISTILLLTVSFLATKGTVYQQTIKNDSLTYGETVEFTAKSLFSSVRYEYLHENSSEWTNTVPTQIGSHKVRAASNASFGTTRYSDEFSFVISTRSINVEVAEETIQYGNTPTVKGDNFAFNDIIFCESFAYNDLSKAETVVLPKREGIKITNAQGLDVTDCYSILIKSDDVISFSKRPVTITVESKEDVYSGNAISAESFELTDGALAFDDKIEASEYPTRTDVGETDNNPNKVFVISTPDGLDVTENYQITVSVGKLTVTKRPIIIHTGSKKFTYDDLDHYSDEYSLDSSTPLVEGHKIVLEEYAKIKYVGETANQMTFKIVDGDGNDVTDNYSIECNNGTLKMLKREITLGTKDNTWVYDGYEHSLTDYILNNNNQLISGQIITVDETTAIVKVGEYENKVTYRIMSGDKDVTENYNISYSYGTLSVTKRPIHISSLNEEKIYDAKEFVGSLYEIKEGSLADNQSIKTDYTGKITDVGEATNLFDVEIFTQSEENVTENYEITLSYGKLYVKHREITISGSYAEKMYDGTELKYEAYDLISELGVVEWHTVKYVESASIINVGEEDNVIKIEIYEGESNKTSNYIINYDTPSKLCITKRDIIVTANSFENMYDGTVQKDDGYTISGSGLAPEQVADVKVEGGQKYVGTANNVVEYVKIYDKNNEETTSNYDITLVDGIITIIQRDITVISNDAEKMYDGTALENHSAYVSDTEGYGLALNEQIVYSFTGTVTNAESVENLFEATIFAGSEETTSNYNISYIYGTLTVTKRPITVVSEDADKIYDDQALTKHQASVSDTEGYGLAPNQTIEYIYYGAIIDVGSVENEFEAFIYHDYQDVTDNYEITYINGSLTVNKRPIHLSSGDGWKIYDGRALYNDSYSVTSEGMELVYGHKLYTIESTSITNVSKVDNYFKVEVHNRYNQDKTENYEITYTYGTLEIIKRKITITTYDDEKMYDGTPLTNSGYNYDRGADFGLVYGQSINVVNNGSITFVGEAKNTVESVRIYNYYENLTDNYDIVIVEGTLRVTPREITITVLDEEKQYDGTPLVASRYEVGGYGMVYGDKLTVTFTGSQTIPGSSSADVNKWSVTKDGADISYCYIVTQTYPGTLTVTKREISITANSESKIYDGTALTNSGYTVGKSGLAPNQIITLISISGSITNVGTADNIPSGAVIVDANRNNVTEFYSIEYINGVLEITPRDVVVITGSAEKIYDGTPLTKHEYIISKDEGYGIADGQKEDVTVTGTGINVGVYDNTFDIIIRDSNNEDVTSNYNVIPKLGKLTIHKRQIKYKTEGGEKVYDGGALTNGEYSLVNGTIADGQTPQVTATGTQTLAGNSENTLDVKILDGNGDDVTENYDITYELGKLTVTKRKITIKSESKEKMFDKTPLTCPEWSCEEWDSILSELVTVHTLNVKVTGAITLVGEAPNTFEVVIQNDNSENVTESFEIIKEQGTLTVTIAPLVFESTDRTKVYDGIRLYGISYTLKEGCLAPGHMTFVKFENEIINAGSIENKFTVTIRDENYNNVTDMYEISYIYGTLTVLPLDITITAGSDIKQYDGTPLNAPLTIEEPNLDLEDLNSMFETNRFTWAVLNAIGSQTEEGESPSLIPEGGFQIYFDGEPVPMTNFNITCKEGTLRVVNQLLVINLWELQKYYDGTPLNYESTDWYLLGNQLPSNCKVVLNLEGSLTEAGTLDNDLLVETLINDGNLKILDGMGRNITNQYVIVFEGAPLTVSRRTLKITASSAQKVYDGKELVANSYTISKGSLAKGHYIDKISVYGSITEIGISLNTISRYSIVIRDAQGNDVTSNYDISTEYGYLEIVNNENELN